MFMKNFLISLSSLLLGILIFSSCGSEIENYNPSNSSTEYFPLEIGNTWIYQVDSIIYDKKGTQIDTVYHIVKETITESFEDSEGITNFVVERFNKIGNNWVISDIWSALKNGNQAIRNEDNLRFIKLVFPISENKFWDGNAFIDSDNVIVKIAGESIKLYERWSYNYKSVNMFEKIGDNEYDNVTTVEQVDTENSINKRYSLEKYAKGIGLVYKKMIILNTQNNDENIPWESKAEEGFILEQTLLSFTK